MAITLTLGIVKPDAVAGGKTGKIVAHLEDAGFCSRGPPGAPHREPGRCVLRRARGGPFYAELVRS